MNDGRIVKISGPLVVAEGMREANMFDVVRVGDAGLIGEIIEMRGDRASIQVYEETAGLKPGDKIVSTGMPLSVELAPGLIEGIFDGIQRPLEVLKALYGTNITRGINVPSLDREKKWDVVPVAAPGEKVAPGDVLATVAETPSVLHKLMVPFGVSGAVKSVRSGQMKITDKFAVITGEDGKDVELDMIQRCPVRSSRPVGEKLMPEAPMVTGQRNIDVLFPVPKGGTAAIPGPFGSGKTVVQHQIAKWSDVDIVVYIGCGERGNEMTDVLREFPELKDPRTGESLMKRTVLIANTSDMPVAAREISIYTGITIAEYFRDMGYNVAILADSTSRWAEALREMSGRLEEMPGEEGYPAYLTSRLAQYYERAGRVRCLSSDERYGSLTAIGAVSPNGGDISEPVSQATLRIVKVFWGLDAQLAYERHFPAINWLNSYSLYADSMSEWKNKNINEAFGQLRTLAFRLLQEEAELKEIVQLVGVDALSPGDRLVLEISRSLREDFLQQDSFDPDDNYTPMEKQFALLKLVLSYYEKGRAAIERGVDMNELFSVPARERIGRAKLVPPADVEKVFSEITAELESQIGALGRKEA